MLATDLDLEEASDARGGDEDDDDGTAERGASRGVERQAPLERLRGNVMISQSGLPPFI